MSTALLTVDNLGDLDNGSARLAIDDAIARAAKDIDDRGQDGKEREVNIKIRMVRTDAGQGQVVMHVECGTKTPVYRTAGTIANVKVKRDEKTNESQPCLQFQTLDPKDPDQRTFDDYEGQDR